MGRKAQAPTESYAPPLPTEHFLAHLRAPQGSNNFLCVDTDGVERLVEVGSKLRRLKGLIVMRGDFAVVKLFPVMEDDKAKLVGEIVHILDKTDLKEWRKAGAWPEGFGEEPAKEVEEEEQGESDGESAEEVVDDDEAEKQQDESRT
ncbi:hypothetical protein IAT38_007435 [Cryptococcus sp. DSM 104549]